MSNTNNQFKENSGAATIYLMLLRLLKCSVRITCLQRPLLSLSFTLQRYPPSPPTLSILGQAVQVRLKDK